MADFDNAKEKMNYKFLRQIKVHFRKFNVAVHGFQVEKDIWIDLSKNTNPARVFLHELLHVKYPKKSEKEIKYLERKIWNNMSQKERYKLYRNLFSRKWDSTPVPYRAPFFRKDSF